MKASELPRFHIVGTGEPTLHLEGAWVPVSRLPHWRDVKTDPPRQSQNLIIRIGKEGEDSYVGQYYYPGRKFYVLDVTGKMLGIPDPYQWAEILVPLESGGRASG